MSEKIISSSNIDSSDTKIVIDLPTSETLEGKKIVLTPKQQVEKDRLIRAVNSSTGNALFNEYRYDLSGIQSLPKEVLQQITKDAVLRRLSKGGYIDDDMRRYLGGVEEVLLLHDAQKAAVDGIIYMIEPNDGFTYPSEYNFKKIIEFIDEFHIPKEVIHQIAKTKITKLLYSGYVLGAKKIKEELLLANEDIQQAVKEVLIETLTKGWLDQALIIKKEFSIADEIVSSPEVQQAADDGVVSYVSCNEDSNPEILAKIVSELFMPENTVQWAAKEAIVESLSYGDLGKVFNIKNRFNINDEVFSLPETKQAAMEGLTKLIMSDNDENYSDFHNAKWIRDLFKISGEEFDRVIKESFFKSLATNRFSIAFDLKDNFNLVVTSEEVLKEFPDVMVLVDHIDKLSPGFIKHLEKSQDILFSLFQFRKNPEQLIEIIEQNPFLIDALSENPKMGSKLLLKFPQLDQISQENISTLYEIKNQIIFGNSKPYSGSFNKLSEDNIFALNSLRKNLPREHVNNTTVLSENSKIDPESFEFRQLMQEGLRDYKNNPEVLRAIEASGIDVEQWLNYAETSYFQLESGAGLSFSESVATPLFRIKETIDSYSNRIKEVLSQYRDELANTRISLDDPKEIQERIVVMQNELEKARAEGNDKKAQGIQKGIDNLKSKLDSPKMASLWDKLLGDIQAFQGLKNDVFSAQEKLIEVERQFEEKASAKTPSGKEIQELKQKITKFKEELRNKFGILESRMENFQNNLGELLKKSVGEDRSGSIVQEIKTGLEEQFNHYSTDRSTLANLFSEKTDRDKEKMEGQPMSIFVWARNPDIDLYQANYSPCCISIESGCASNNTESAIADYLTDLGIQIVNIWDETKGEPVTAAWCWLGEDKQGSPALVVDNIESNPTYSINYPQQLSKELFSFLEKYAKSIGVSKLVLGKDNNDLPTAGEMVKMIDDTEVYGKIGGYHREDGYYLEAVDDSVKIIWEKNAELEIKNIEIKQNVVKFEKVQTSNLSEYDFENLLKMEEKIYPEDYIQGETLIQEIRDNNGLEYSFFTFGIPEGETKEEPVGYLVAVEDETDEGEPTVYLEDIAVLPEAQGQGVAWKMIQELIKKLQAKSKSKNKPVLLDMHLREASQGLFEKHEDDLAAMGVKLIEESFVSDYYDGEDALYKVYQVAV